MNRHDEMFQTLADQYDQEIDHSSTVIGKILEPFIIVFIALIVGFVLIAMYYPMTNLSQVMTR